MRELLRMRLRRRHLRSLLAVGVVTMFAALTVVAGLEVRRGEAERLDQLFVESGRPDLIASGNPEALKRALAADPDVEAFTLSPTTFGSVVLGDGTSVAMWMVGIDPENLPAIDPPQIVKGRLATKDDQIVIDAALANEDGFEIGDTVVVERGGSRYSMELVGTAIDLSQCFYPQCRPVRGYFSPAGHARLLGAATSQGRAAVRVTPGAAVSVVAERLVGEDRIHSAVPWSERRERALLTGEIFSVFLSGFGLFMLAAAGVVVANTAVGAVIARRRELAILKSIGVTPGQVALATLLESTAVATIGVLVGWVLGSMAAPLLHVGLVGALGRPAPRFDPFALAVALAVVVTVLAVAGLMPALRAGRLRARDALADVPKPAATALTRWIARQRLPLTAKLGSQLALARPLRAFLAAGAIALAITAGVTGWRLNSAVSSAVDNTALSGMPYDAWLSVPDVVPEDVVAGALNDHRAIESWYRETTEEAEGANGGDVTVRTVLPDLAAATFVVVEGRQPSADDEALIGWGGLRELDVVLGDRITLDVEEGSLSVTLVGRVADLSSAGEIVIISATARSQIPWTIEPNGWRISGVKGVERAAFSEAVDASFEGRALVAPVPSARDRLGPFRAVMVGLVAIVSIVALANLGATMLATARERRRQLGVIRAVGFGPRELRTHALSSGVTIGLIAIVVGVPAALFVSNAVLMISVEQLGYGPGVLTPGWIVPCFVCALIAVALSAAATYAATRRLHVVETAMLVRED